MTDKVSLLGLFERAREREQTKIDWLKETVEKQMTYWRDHLKRIKKQSTQQDEERVGSISHSSLLLFYFVSRRHSSSCMAAIRL